MKKNLPLFASILALVTASCAIGVALLYKVDPKWALSQLCAIGAGVGAMALVLVIGWKRLTTASAFFTGGIVAILCIACLLCEPHQGRHVFIAFDGHRLFSPVHLILPTVVLLMVTIRRLHYALFSVGMIAAACYFFAVYSFYLPAVTMAPPLLALLYGFAMRDQRHIGRRWAAVSAVAVSPWVVREVFLGGDFGKHCDGADILHDYIMRTMSETPWFAGHSPEVQFLPFDNIWSGALENACCHLGRWTTIAIPALTLGLVVCFALVVFRAKDPRKRILALGGSFVLLTPMVLGISRYFLWYPLHEYAHPFIVAGGSYMVASFVSLGLILVTLLPDDRDCFELKCKYALDGTILLILTTAVASGLAGFWLRGFLSGKPSQFSSKQPTPTASRSSQTSPRANSITLLVQTSFGATTCCSNKHF